MFSMVQSERSFFPGMVEWCFCRGFCKIGTAECGVFVVSLW